MDAALNRSNCQVPLDLSDDPTPGAAWEESDRLPIPVAVFVGCFILSALTMGDHPTLAVIPYGLGVASAFVLGILYLRSSPPIPLPVFLYLAFLVWAGVGALGARFTDISLRALRTHAQFAVMITVFATICQDTRTLRITSVFVVLGALANVVAAAQQGWTGVGGRVVGLLHNPNGTAICIGVAIIMCWSNIALFRGFVKKLILLGLIGLLHFALIKTGSRGGFLATVMGELAMLWMYRRAILQSPSAVSLLVIGGLAGAIALPGWFLQTGMGKRFTATATTIGGEAGSMREGSTAERVRIKFIAMQESIQHPLFGLGRGNFWPTGVMTGRWSNTTHDGFLNTLVETGFPGFALYYGIHFWVWRRAGRVRKSDWATEVERHLSVLIRSFLIFSLCGDLFDEASYRDKTTWAFMAISAGMLQGVDVRIRRRMAAFGASNDEAPLVERPPAYGAR